MWWKVVHDVKERLQFLGALEKLLKATISFVMSVCPSVRPHGTIRRSHSTCFKEIRMIFENMSCKLKFHYDMTRITGILHEDQCIFFIISL